MKKIFLSIEAWIFIFLTLLSMVVINKFVDLNPHVDYDAFFSNKDPNYKADVEISRLFPRNDSQIIISVRGDIYAEEYKNKIKSFGDQLKQMDHIADVKSVMHGPRSVHAAVKSEFWNRLLISKDKQSSNMIVMFERGMSSDKLPQIIPRIEHLKDFYNSPHFPVKISGFPYIVELIRRHLNHDLKTFSLMAFVVFGLVAIIIFHSWLLLIGTVVSCILTATLTLTLSHLLDVQIGILTANLTTIVFVLTLSHIVFLTFNWKGVYPSIDERTAAKEAVKITFSASFWAMVTTLLGFISMLWVPAKPIRELGISGAIGTLLAFFMAFGVYPTFLRLLLPFHKKSDERMDIYFDKMFDYLEERRVFVVVLITCIVFLTLPYLKTLNTDPSLISFFSKKSPITEGLKYIDQNGGSNPLVVVVKGQTGQPLYSKQNIKKLWGLQRDLENHPDVGTVISIPLLLSEARSSVFLSFLMTNRFLLHLMQKPKY